MGRSGSCLTSCPDPVDASEAILFTHYRRIRQQLDTNGNGSIDAAQNIVYDADWKPGLEDIVLIFDESDDMQHRFLHGPGIDQPLADEQPAKLHWLLPSQLSTITDVIEYIDGTDTTTNINHITYTSFGQIASQTNSSNEPYYTYTAREWDGDAELYYYRARWYDPVVGRFVSEDPIGYVSLEYNFYRYAKNSPLILIDPGGELVPAVLAGLAVALAVCGYPFHEYAHNNYGPSSDKFKHCWVSCQISRACTGILSQYAGLGKEAIDIVKGLIGYEEYPGFVDSLDDLFANQQCIHWESYIPVINFLGYCRESCYDCCVRKIGFH